MLHACSSSAERPETLDRLRNPEERCSRSLDARLPASLARFGATLADHIPACGHVDNRYAILRMQRTDLVEETLVPDRVLERSVHAHVPPQAQRFSLCDLGA